MLNHVAFSSVVSALMSPGRRSGGVILGAAAPAGSWAAVQGELEDRPFVCTVNRAASQLRTGRGRHWGGAPGGQEPPVFSRSPCSQFGSRSAPGGGQGCDLRASLGLLRRQGQQ